MEKVRLCNMWLLKKEQDVVSGSFMDHEQESTCFKVKKTYLYL